MADRHAVVSPVRKRALGSAQQSGGRTDRTGSVLRAERANDPAARVRQKDTTDTRTRVRNEGRIGSSFDEFLKDDDLYAEATARAIKRVIARQLDAQMRQNGMTKTTMARLMRTSRARLDRLLDPENESVTRGTLARAARVVGRTLRMELI